MRSASSPSRPLVYLLGLVCAAAGLLPASPALATSYVLLPDAELADAAPVIAEVRALGADAASLETPPSTRYEVEVLRLLKGDLPGSRVVVRVPGGEAPGGLALHVHGAPRLRLGERALLFLAPRRDGTWEIPQLMLGAFHEAGGREADGATGRLALRDLSEAHEVRLPGAAGEARPGDRVRSYERFAAWLEDRARGVERPADYFVAEEKGGLQRSAAPFTYLGDLRQRWFAFDLGGSVGWRAAQGGQSGLAGGGFSQFQTAIEAWNADPDSDIRYVYQSTTTAGGGLRSADGVNTILFDDPFGEVADSGGVLAVGGTWITLGSSNYNGESYRRVVEGDIVINNNIGPFLSEFGGKNAEEVFAHELGHSLGIGHSAQREALMFARAHDDGRGARLGADDRAAIALLYGNGSGGSSVPPPAAPAALTAVAVSETEVRLEWVDRSGDESHFEVEGREGAGFVSLGTVAADTTAALVTRLTAGTSYTFRVRACNGGGCSAYSNEASATTPAIRKPAAPAGLTASPVGTTQMLLAWQDRSDNEDFFRIEGRAEGESAFRQLTLTPADTGEHIVLGLQPATGYIFRVRACNAGGCSPYSNQVAAATAGGTAPQPPPEPPSQGPCAGFPGALCLAGGRFAAEVTWRDQRRGTSGTGGPISDSDDSGFFWFFDPANIELVVKVLDARPVNGHFWVFYGGLSDVEYTLTVTDTVTGERKSYRNRPGSICGEGDVTAFAGAAATAGSLLGGTPDQPAPRLVALTAGDVGAADGTAGELTVTGAATAGPCAPGPGTLCLLDGRFEVSVEWANQRRPGERGEGGAVDRSDLSGTFWFFDPDNVELVVKLLDGRPVNGHFWFFYGALSDVEYTIRVRDTVERTVRTYRNEPGEICGLGDVRAF